MSVKITEGSKTAEERPVVFRSREHQGRHELGDQRHLDRQSLMTHHDVHHLAQAIAVHLRVEESSQI